MKSDLLLLEIYFDALRQEAFSAKVNRGTYEGVLRVLHDIPFSWDIWSDENRAGDAITYRQYGFLGQQTDLSAVDKEWLTYWSLASPSVFEVLMACARRFVEYFGGHTAYYFGHMFRNLNLDRYPGRALDAEHAEVIREKLNAWMSHQIAPDGTGSPFPLANPVTKSSIDMRAVDIWAQMNAYASEHFL